MSSDRQVSLWDSNKFECVQTIRDQHVFPYQYFAAYFEEKKRIIYTGALQVKCYTLKPNEKEELENLQINVLVEQSKQEMDELIFAEAKYNIDSPEGKIIYNQMLLEKKGTMERMKSHFGQ